MTRDSTKGIIDTSAFHLANAHRKRRAQSTAKDRRQESSLMAEIREIIRSH